MAAAEFDDIQKVVLTSYEDGEFSYLTPDEVPDCGDGLLKFLLVELSSKEDCDSLDTELSRVNTAIRQLAEVTCAIERQLLAEEYRAESPANTADRPKG